MKVHLVAICGTGMGSLAGLLKEAGHDVTGSDRSFYPPMSERLQAWGIPMMQGFDPAHIAPGTDLVIVGNVCRKDNPEAQAALQRGFRVMSFPQALSEFFIAGKTSVVVAGTHGKTTTASLLSYVLVEAGLDPSFLVGGIPQNFGKSFHLGQGKVFVVEGDEYDAAFFDKRPKFIHYRPNIVLLTAVEFDHADIYPDMTAYRAAFQQLLALLPADGTVIACTDDPEVKALTTSAPCRVVRYGLGAGSMWTAADIDIGEETTRFCLIRDGVPFASVTLPLAGRHNVSNTVGVLATASMLGVDVPMAAASLAGFAGIARRMQVRGVVDGVTVIDDFAHHPTKVRETVRAARARYPGARLVAVFEPRTNTSRRKFFQEIYPASFAAADEVIVVPPFDIENIPSAERFDSAALVMALRQMGKHATLHARADQVVADLSPRLGENSVVLIMSNGAFDGIHEKLLTALRNRNDRSA
ncbi:MAG TPA: UDP-N-acetylmuramate:L-alanyl-gamma-D-glutamyl-meso-diaminopimelate ligase [Candidatus Baltobacteraceae bacterium]|nr:UDP-N-acetylmuramate:L-alanyl-gamma-D-glutamyl-meso-diaminopimelate ligase [Candidatus Baltobacteraceae bacterium]